MKKTEAGVGLNVAVKSECPEILKDYDRYIRPRVKGFYLIRSDVSTIVGIRISIRREKFNGLRGKIESLLEMAEIDVRRKALEQPPIGLRYDDGFVSLFLATINSCADQFDRATFELEHIGNWIKREAGYIVGK
jgi:hypothetical protein